MSATRTVFLPGASGRRDFWAPVAQRLCLGTEPLLLGWPGFGDEPMDDNVTSLTDLVDFVLCRIEPPVDVVAQSMGGVVALLLTLRRPDAVRRLVLAGTSGGLDVSRFDALDWREDYARDYLPSFSERPPSWFVDDRTDIEAQLPSVSQPALLVFGTEDRIAPVALGEHLATRLPNVRLVKIEGAQHDGPVTHAGEVARHIQPFLSAP